MKTQTFLLFAAAMTMVSAGCSVPGKSLGMESDGASETGDDAGDGDDDGPGSSDGSGPTATGGDQGGDGSETGVGSDGSDGNDTVGADDGCDLEPPDAPDCATCTQNDACEWECDVSTCALDCPADGCGGECIVCQDEACTSWDDGLCNPDGSCVIGAEPDMCQAGLNPGFELELTQQAGCADMAVYASSPDGTLGLVLVINGLNVNDVTKSAVFELEHDDAARFEVLVGTNVTQDECNDAPIPPGPQIDATWTPVDGTMSVEINPGLNPTASVTISDAVLTNGFGATVALDNYVFSDVVVGWFPG